MKNKYSTLIFDLDGTLIDSMPPHIKAFEKIYLVRGIRIETKEIMHLIGLPAAEIIKFLNKKHKVKENVLKMRDERRDYFFEFIKNKELTIKGVKQTIKKLSKNYKMAIVTGSSRKSYLGSTDKEFQKIFDYVVCVDDVKRAKPAPDELILAMKKLKVKPSECLMTGDSIFDQIAAKRAKMDSVGVLTGYTSAVKLKKAGAKFVIKNVNELNKVI
jgi:HAD superfamily hydrolase (TIGR01509 family)